MVGKSSGKLSLGIYKQGKVALGDLSFSTGREASVCDGQSPFFSGTPLCIRTLIPTFDHTQNFWSPHQTDTPLPIKK